MTPWWKSGVFYQIYPRSYKDTSGNGVGDLKGITEKLDYIASLGVDGVWISPFFKSPMKDYGYDVQDYRQIDPLFGTLDDFKALLKGAHERNVKIVIDKVLSHTSNQHEWFQASRTDKDGPYGDFYVWADPNPDGTPPTNWLSVFGGPAWSYDFYREQYYLHNFLSEQPDLNVRKKEVQDALLEEIKFWLDLGVDGLRLDAVNFCCHDEQMRDNPVRQGNGLATQLLFKDPYGMQSHVYDKSRPKTLEFVKRLRALTDQYPGVFMLGEIGDDNPAEAVAAYTKGDDKLHTCYSFALATLKPYSASALVNAVNEYEKTGWPSWAFSNHDLSRAVTRWSEKTPDKQKQVAKMLIALLTTLRGTPFIYQGEELGLPEGHITEDQIQDPWGKFLYPKWIGRDGCRTPMPWQSVETHAGFSKAETTWLPVDPKHHPLAVDRQEKDPESVLHFTREFLAWRKQQTVFDQESGMRFIETKDDRILSFTRTHPEQTINLRFNLSPDVVDGLNPFAFQIDEV